MPKALNLWIIFCILGCAFTGLASAESSQQDYLDFFEDVFETFKDNYYKDVKREDFDQFLSQFEKKILPQLEGAGKSVDFVRWRSTAYLVDYLKDEEDIFSAFYPPQPAKEYEQTSLGKRIDLGIEGEMLDVGYRVTFVEPRSDAHTKGLRENDLIVAIDKQEAPGLDEATVKELLTPLEGAIVRLVFLNGWTRKRSEIEVISEEYFKQAVFDVPMPVPGIYCLELQKFNRKTSDDIFRYLQFYKQKGAVKGLIIDLRGNPGGPPLAAREISSFFLEPGSEFAYFKKKDEPKILLDVPVIPEEFRYSGPIVILINEKSGSASELFSGTLQKRGRAFLMGQNSAGQVMLKSMFHFDDESMLLLITSRGHHPDGAVFSFDGLDPDKFFPDEDKDKDNVLETAVKYLMYVSEKQKQL